MALKDTLELIISANVSGAVSGLEKVGATAEKELGKTSSHMEQLGGHMQVAGAAMVGIGAVALGAFGEMAKAAEEAHLSDVKLADSVQKAGEAAGGSVEPFKKLAEEMGKKTTFDHVQVEATESKLLTMGLEKDKVLQLTPLIADLAAKNGIDLTEATKKVTGALNGKQKGLVALIGPLDQVAYKTDKYAAIQDALSKKVGGFAEQEGKTFSGQLEILGHQFKDLEEGVGVGVVDAFSTLLGGISGVTGALGSLGPEVEANIGKWGTFAAVGLTVVGVGSLVAGTVMKAGESLGRFANFIGLATTTTVENTAVTEANAAAQAAQAAALAAGATAAEAEAAGLEVMGAAELTTAADTAVLEIALGPVAIALTAVAAVMYFAADSTKAFTFSAKELADIASGEALPALDKLDAVMSLTGQSVYGLGKSMAEKSIPAAEKYAKALDDSGRSGDEVRRSIDDVKAAHEKDAEAAAADAAAHDDASLAAQGLTAAEIALVDQLKAEHDQVKASLDPMFAAQSAMEGVAKAQEAVVKASQDIVKAQDGVEKSQQGVNDALAKHGPASKEADAANDKLRTSQEALTAAQQKYPDVQQQTITAAYKQEAAMNALGQEILKHPGMLQDGLDALERWRQQGIITKEVADRQATAFRNMAIDVKNIPEGHTTTVVAETDWAKASLNDIYNYINNIPRSVSVDVHVQAVSDAIGGVAKWFGRASGGPVISGTPYMVGEEGPEMFVPGTNGQIIPHGQSMAAMGGTPVGGGDTHYNFYGPVLAEETYLMSLLERATRKGNTPGAATRQAFAA